MLQLSAVQLELLPDKGASDRQVWSIFCCTVCAVSIYVLYCATLRFEGMVIFNICCVHICGAGGSAVGWFTALQARKSRFRLFARWLLGFFTNLILPAALWVLGSTEPLKQRNTANISLGLRWTVRRGESLITFLYRLSWILGVSASWNPQVFVQASTENALTIY